MIEEVLNRAPALSRVAPAGFVTLEEIHQGEPASLGPCGGFCLIGGGVSSAEISKLWVECDSWNETNIQSAGGTSDSNPGRSWR
jgi:hypothetical protein